MLTGDRSKPPEFPETGINASTLTVTSVQPAVGPFAGGNRVVVRGSGFTDESLVFFDGRMVQPAQTLRTDNNSLQVVVPAGRVGNVDVRVAVGDESATLEDAYSYSPLLLEPINGSIAGGTSVAITVNGADFDSGVRVEFAGAACTDLEVVSPNQVRCKTPKGAVGMADVAAYWPEDTERARLEAPDGFEYLDLTDTDRGGLSGGEIERHAQHHRRRAEQRLRGARRVRADRRRCRRPSSRADRREGTDHVLG